MSFEKVSAFIIKFLDAHGVDQSSAEAVIATIVEIEGQEVLEEIVVQDHLEMTDTVADTIAETKGRPIAAETRETMTAETTIDVIHLLTGRIEMTDAAEAAVLNARVITSQELMVATPSPNVNKTPSMVIVKNEFL